MQTQITAGDSFLQRWAPPSAPASDGWSLKLRLVPVLTGGQAIELSSVADGAGHKVSVAPAVTAEWAPGVYTWSAWVERNPDVWTVAQGRCEIKPDPRTLPVGHDGRSLAQRTLDDLQAAFATWSSSRGMTRSYTVHGRQMEFNSSDEILSQIRYWKQQVAQEKEDARRARGGKPRNHIKVRFVRPR